MRTREIFRYLVAMIIALSTTVNAMAQQRALKIYFNENGDTATGPRILVKDDNGNYELPKGLKVTLGGAVWADKARFWEMFQRDVSDRVIAAYTASDKKESKLTLNFTNFPYEVNMIQWNVMNDLLSASVLNLLDNYRVTTKCIQSNDGGWSYTDEHWDMNFLFKNTSFTQRNVPWRENAVLNGLKSFEIGEQCWKKSPLGILINQQAELDDKCRTFIKAGWNGSNTNSNIDDSDDSNWAFKVTFTLPDIRMRCYSCRISNNITLGELDNNIIKGESGKHALRGYIAAHAGAVVPTHDPSDIDAFHYEYFAEDPNQIEITQNTGVISNAKVAGDIPVTVKLMRGTREVCSKTEYIHVMAPGEVRAKIAIGFENGNKGYDITVGDQNAQIKGVFTENANNIAPTVDPNGYHFEYTESSSGQIIEIDKYTGKITAKKEGDVDVSAVLKDGEKIISNTYTYSLHVFAKHEGLEFRRINTYQYTTSSNNDNWKISSNQTNQSNNEWKPNNLLRVNTSMENVTNAGQNDWKQIASYSVNSSNNWRAICQEIAFDLYVPKYTKATATYTMAGNADIGNKNNGNCRYGFELFYVNQGNNNVSLEQATTWLGNRNWDTKNNGTSTNSSVTARWATDSYHSSIGDYGYYVRSTNNVDAEDSYKHKSYTVYFAAMAYLWKDQSYPGNVSIGFKGIPTYTYYSTVTYYMNDGTENTYGTDSYTSDSKTGTDKLYKNPNSDTKPKPTRVGYEFLGWSTNPEATVAEYEYQGQFCPYDDVNGGGKGPVSLYAVWRANTYIVELKHKSTGPIDGYVYAVYDQNMPLVDVDGNAVKAPTNKGYDFGGYFAEKNGSGTKYYNVDMSSNHVWDRTDENYVIARWIPHTTTVVFDPQGGNNYGATRVTATFSAAMPTEGVQAPQRQGYTFGGYYSEANGQGTQYYTSNMTSATTWDIDERLLDPQVTEVTLYAKWISHTYTVTLDPQGGTGGSTSVTAAYGQPLPSGLTAPTKPGYEFRGYYGIANSEWEESQGNDIYYGGKEYYDKDMNGVEPWDKTEAATIYAHWAPKTYIVTFDTKGATLPQGIIAGNRDLAIEQASDGIIKIRFTSGVSVNNTIDNSKPKKPAYQLLGFYDNNDVLVATITVDDSNDRHIYLTGAGNYWEQNGNNVKWVHDGDLTLTAKYEPKFTVVDGNMIKFGSETKVAIIEPKHDWLMAVVNDLVGAAQEVGSKENPVMVFDLKNSKNIWTGNGYNCKEVMESLQDLINDSIISPNVLVYFNDNSYIEGQCNNAILSNMTCPNLYVTDRFSMKIPYTFDAGKATYARDAQVNDAATEQASGSSWGTLCLPYAIKNNNSHVKLYWLESTANNYMEFKEFDDNAIIPANTPVLYCRTDGKVSSRVTIEEVDRNVPQNMTYHAETIAYANPKEGTYPLENASETLNNWEFTGNLRPSAFYGKDYNKPLLAGYIGEKEGTDYIYYFKQNKFTRLGDKSSMILYPYRAYFRKVDGVYKGAKIAEFSILVIGEDGSTTDITNAIFGDGEGDGKIYDLNGIRVMQPVKGRLYIVNGQKKVYR